MKSNYITLFFLLLLGFVFSCNNDEEGSSGLDGSHIEISELSNFLPSAIRSGNNVNFRSPADAQLTLMTDYRESVDEQTLGEDSFTSDRFLVSMTEGASGDYIINLVGSATSDTKSFNVLLIPANGTDPVRGAIPFDHITGTSIGQPSQGEFFSSLDLGGMAFTDVFKFNREISSSFSELYINEEVGVVAFRDGDNTLWIFNGFE